MQTIGKRKWLISRPSYKKLAKESDEKEARIKFEEEKIAKLTKKLEKPQAQSSTKDLESEEEEKTWTHSEIFDKEE